MEVYTSAHCVDEISLAKIVNTFLLFKLNVDPS